MNRPVELGDRVERVELEWVDGVRYAVVQETGFVTRTTKTQNVVTFGDGRVQRFWGASASLANFPVGHLASNVCNGFIRVAKTD